MVQIGNLVIDDETKQLKFKEKQFSNEKEFLILYMLVQTAGRFHTREQILNNVWNDESFVLERTVDVHIARLRKKLLELLVIKLSIVPDLDIVLNPIITKL